MQQEAESHSESGGNQPFLLYACTRIQKTKPSLLNIKEELPSLHTAVEQIDWDTVNLDLEELEASFEAFREFSLAFSSDSNARSAAAISVEEEIDLLQRTSVGAFAVDACLKMAEIYGADALSTGELHKEELEARFLKWISKQ